VQPEQIRRLEEDLDVSRETLDLLRGFCDDLVRWSKSINLVSDKTYQDAWSRHIVDSLQIARSLDGVRRWVDVGSGGGLPAIPLAVIDKARGGSCQFVLIESDGRKSAFLKTQAHKLGLKVMVENRRSEAVDPLCADVLSARAFAPLTVILEQARRHLVPDGVAVLHKGRSIDLEISEARKNWEFSYKVETSVVESDSVILRVADIKKKAVMP